MPTPTTSTNHPIDRRQGIEPSCTAPAACRSARSHSGGGEMPVAVRGADALRNPRFSSRKTTRFIVGVLVLLVGALCGAVSAAAGDSTIDTLAGNSGWAGAGLLGLVLSWLLLWHLPAKDTQLAAMHASQQAHVESITKLHASEMKDIVAAFVQESREQRAESRAEFQMLAAAVHKDLETIGQLIMPLFGTGGIGRAKE